MTATGTLYLLPVPISDDSGLEGIPEYNLTVISKLKNFIAEDAKTARRYLKLFGYPGLAEADIRLLNEHTGAAELSGLLDPLLRGEDTGLMSDAGCPGIADPGAQLISVCHTKKISVRPLTGPSSIVLAIMASGFNGQNFAFNGYLPVEKVQRVKRLKELEQLSARTGQAQYFIETPYRNMQMMESILGTLQRETKVFVGRNIGDADALLRSGTVGVWKSGPMPGLHKVPVVFGIFR